MRVTLVFMIVMIALIAATFQSDYTDLVKRDEAYCSAVNQKIWPDYLKLYKTMCK